MRVVLLLVVTATAAIQAQGGGVGGVGGVDSIARAPEDSIIERAKQLAADNRLTDGRRLLDSLLATTPPESAVYADALYWRAALAPTAADAERDYRRLLIEAPLSARAEDALLQLAQLEQARGDRRGASDHLQRFMLSYPRHPARPRVALTLVRLLFEQGPQQVARACEALRSGRDEIPPENAELRNQLEFYAPRCAFVEAAPAAVDSLPATPGAADSVPPVRDSARRREPPRPAPSAATSFYSVQVAAYNSREPAAHLADLLKTRGLDARVDGTAAPFRVRVGKYATRAAAVRAAATLKGQGYNGFVTLVSAK